jgi:hypothetical protein
MKEEKKSQVKYAMSLGCKAYGREGLVECMVRSQNKDRKSGWTQNIWI